MNLFVTATIVKDQEVHWDQGTLEADVESGSPSSKIDQRDFHKKLKEFTMNIQYKLEGDRISLLTRAIVPEELLKQQCIVP